MLNKLALSLARLMQAHPAYKRASVATIRKMLGWETEENFGRLFEVVDRSAFSAALASVKVTAADRRRYAKILEEAEESVW